MSLPIGVQTITADGVIGVSGKKIRLYQLIVISDGTATVVNVYDGVSASGTKRDVVNGSATDTTRVPYVGGLACNSGLFIDVDAHTTSVTAIYEQENS